MYQTLKTGKNMVHRCVVAMVSWFVLAITWAPALAQGRGGVLRIGMTAADIPYTGGQPDQGFEGFRFIGFQLYDGLTAGTCRRGQTPRTRAWPGRILGDPEG